MLLLLLRLRLRRPLSAAACLLLQPPCPAQHRQSARTLPGLRETPSAGSWAFSVQVHASSSSFYLLLPPPPPPPPGDVIGSVLNTFLTLCFYLFKCALPLNCCSSTCYLAPSAVGFGCLHLCVIYGLIYRLVFLYLCTPHAFSSLLHLSSGHKVMHRYDGRVASTK